MWFRWHTTVLGWSSLLDVRGQMRCMYLAEMTRAKCREQKDKRKSTKILSKNHQIKKGVEEVGHPKTKNSVQFQNKRARSGNENKLGDNKKEKGQESD